MYEVSSLDVLTSKDYLDKLNNPTPDTDKQMVVLTTMERRASKVVHSVVRSEFAPCKGGVVGSTIAHLVLEFPEDKEQELRDWVVNTLSAGVLASHHSVLALHVVEPDEAAGKAGSSSVSYQQVRLTQGHDVFGSSKKWILLVEFSYTRTGVMKHSRSPMLKESLVEKLSSLGGKVVSNQVYELLCVATE